MVTPLSPFHVLTIIIMAIPVMATLRGPNSLYISGGFIRLIITKEPPKRFVSLMLDRNELKQIMLEHLRSG